MHLEVNVMNMKKTTLTLALVCICILLNAQSKSFRTFKNKFSHEEDVNSVSVNGFFVRTLLTLGGEFEAGQALKHVRTVRVTAVPKDAFRTKGVTVNGFRNVMRDDSFEEMFNVSDKGDKVAVFVKAAGKNDNCYLVLAEESNKVVLIELTGYLDPELLKEQILSIDI